MGLTCSRQLPNGTGFRRRKAMEFFRELDERLAANLLDDSVKLVDANFLRNTELTHMVRRQDLEVLEQTQGVRIFVPPKLAVKLLAKARRVIAVLTYGWNTPDNPDPTGEYLAAVIRFLLSSEGAHIEAVFWDYPSLPQKPRSKADGVKFVDALDCMGDLYASPLGTTVIRHRTIPKRPAELDGVVVVMVAYGPPAIVVPFHHHKLHLNHDKLDAGCDLCDSEDIMYTCAECDWDLCKDCSEPFTDDIGVYEAGFRNDLIAAGVAPKDILDLTTDVLNRRWMVRLSSQELAESATARLTARMGESSLPTGSYCFCFFNDRPYFAEGDIKGRGWTTFESGVGGEAIYRLMDFPLLKGHLDSLPPKFIEIDGATPLVTHADASQRAMERSAVIRADIAAANFTGSGDKPKVIELYHDYVVEITNAINDADDQLLKRSWWATRLGVKEKRSTAVEQQRPVYEGDLDLTQKDEKKQRHGAGSLRWLDGSSYEGQFVHGNLHGHGIYRHATGDVYEGEFRDDEEHGFGIYTQPSGYVYAGQWDAGDKTGEASELECDGAVYIGEWKKDSYDGPGKKWFASGNFYEGQWKDGDFHGLGYLFDHRDEAACVSRWREDSPVSPGISWVSSSGVCWDSARVVRFVDLTDGSYQIEVERLVSVEEARKLTEEMGAAVPPFPAVPPKPMVVGGPASTADATERRSAPTVAAFRGAEVPPAEDLVPPRLGC